MILLDECFFLREHILKSFAFTLLGPQCLIVFSLCELGGGGLGGGGGGGGRGGGD